MATQSSSLAWLAMLGWSVSSESSASAYLVLPLSYPYVVLVSYGVYFVSKFNDMERTEITASSSLVCCSSLNYSPEPLLDFTANIIEVLEFGWIHICTLTSAIIELFWASVLQLHWTVLLLHWIKLHLTLNCHCYSLNCTTAPLDETVVNCSYWWYSYWIQLELHFVSSITDFHEWISYFWIAVEYKTAYSGSIPKANATNFQDQCIKCTS